MTTKKIKTTKLDIIKCASELFFTQGYSNTPPKDICEKLGIYVGNTTYYFPTKEHLLTVFVQILCDFQWEMMQTQWITGQNILTLTISQPQIQVVYPQTAKQNNT
ncbi:MAG: helix-turn-helix transcriptional regulator [Clostridia bacterium]|nr:helix-turn-helix transcriptional regulator [Clostridia bacterium]